MSGGEFAAIEARMSAATEGPWSVGGRNPNTGGFWFGNMNPDVPGPVGDAADGDVQFIAAARTDIPRLLAAVRERDNTIARAEAAVASAALKVLADFDTVMNVRAEVAYIVAEYNRAIRAALDPQETP